jgi:hypothetical protein
VLEAIKIDYKKDITLKRRPLAASLFFNNHKTKDYMCKTSFTKLDRAPRDVNVENKAFLSKLQGILAKANKIK